MPSSDTIEDTINAILNENTEGLPKEDAVIDPDISDIPQTTAGTFGPGTSTRTEVGGEQMPKQPVIDMNTYVREGLEDLLEGKMSVNLDRSAFSTLFESEDGESQLDEEMVTGAIDMFESACNEKLNEVAQTILEGADAYVSSEVAKRLDEESEKIDRIAEEAAQEFMTENQLAIQNGMRLENAESFMTKMQELFLEHFVAVPGERVDLLEALQTRIDKLEEAASEKLDENVSLKIQLDKANKVIWLNESVSDLTAIQAEKVKKLAESIDVDTAEAFEEAIKPILESVVSPAKSNAKSETLMEDGMVSEDAVNVDDEDSVARWYAGYNKALNAE